MIGQNPFTPRSGQEPKVFIGREKEIGVFEKHLKDALNKKYNHFITTGGWGIGKTTLLKEFKKIAQSKSIISSTLNVPEFIEKDLLTPVINLISQLPRNLPIKREKLKSFYESMKGIGITIPVIGGGIEFKEKNKYEGDPQGLLLDSMIKLWKSLKNDMKALVVLLDDVQNYRVIPEFLTLLKNVLSDSEFIENTGYLFVLSSTYDGWNMFLQKLNPIGRYFIPILKLENISKKSSDVLIQESLKETGVAFSSDVTHNVFEITEGHPFLIQIICNYLFDNQIKGKVSIEQFDTSLNQAISELSPIILDPLYFKASGQEKDILHIMSSEYRIYTFEELLISAKKFKIGKGHLSATLNRLYEKGMIVKIERGKYRIINKIFNIYLEKK
ncbi:MAG: hypothetical protein HY959_00385 [Ignavibacteriae bacterium]|nr:hypothetical protein [Ignavibacteriota bacterium]